MSSELIATCRFKIQQQEKNISANELQQLFDHIVQEFHNTKDNLPIRSIKDVVTVLTTVGDYAKYSDASILNHHLFIILRNTLVILFQKWNTSNKLNDQEVAVFQGISVLFVWLTINVNDTNINHFKTIFVNKSLIESIIQCINSITTNDKHLDSANLICLNKIITALHILQYKRLELRDDPLLLDLLDSIVNFLCSTHYVETFKRVQPDSTQLTIREEFVLLICPGYVVYCFGKDQENICLRLCNYVLIYFTNILSIFTKLISKWNKAIVLVMKCMVSMLQKLALSKYLQRDRNQHIQLIDYINVILNSVNSVHVLRDDTGVILLSYSIVYLFSLTFEPTLLTVIKEKKLASTILKLIDENDDYVSVNAYHLLSLIIDEQDIEKLENSKKIIKVFIGLIKKNIEDISRIVLVQNTLISLKSFVRHNKIRNELIKQTTAIQMLVQITTEKKLNIIEVQQHTIEILCILTFNQKVANILKNDQMFIIHIESLLGSKQATLQKAAEKIILQLQKDNREANTGILISSRIFGISTIPADHFQSNVESELRNTAKSNLAYLSKKCFCKENSTAYRKLDSSTL
ncbi:unnamed protein product [Didymodactylos carnosus]|uniref:Uncharacterized protein n=1 Tax=Didymodactylos carnosus TaxID=1234261 RepID=A0A814SXR6_9BILA|nr:unnamed protein product [Didymodactylos carnosus]CAF1153957.1 unnamed protein product [Didymodactylos carnosus]CAF3550221.1 unnamed protein product [Didymodactylos carnosus]CAF3917421.1 unnamed protein product [Didymodactylos carnosus]